jgi:SAM-dependent methyltransferase
MNDHGNNLGLEPPKGWLKGLIPTMNDTGFMFEVLDNFAEEFIQYSSACGDEVLELGCAYGVATLPALEAGATVRACDIDQRHLDILRAQVPASQLSRLTTELQRLPHANLPDNQFGAILCSRVVHFLTGAEIDASVANMYRWLKPGGRLYVIADTPYGLWRNFIPVWDANHAKGERWPGHMEPLTDYLPYTPSGDQVGPPFMNLMSPQLLSRACTEAGFEVVRADWIDRNDFIGSGKMDGRENCGIVVKKPD